MIELNTLANTVIINCSSWPAQHVLLFSWLTDIQTQKNKYSNKTLFIKRVIVSVNSTSSLLASNLLCIIV